MRGKGKRMKIIIFLMAVTLMSSQVSFAQNDHHTPDSSTASKPSSPTILPKPASTPSDAPAEAAESSVAPESN